MSKFIGNMVYYHGFPRESAGKCGKFADNLPSPPHRSIAMGQRSCAVLRVWFIVKVPGNLMPPSSVTRGHACVLQGGVSVIGILPTAFLLPAKTTPKVGHTRSRTTTSGYRGRGSPTRRGRQRLTLGPSPSPPFFAREKKRKKKTSRETMPSSPTGLKSQDFSWITVRE